MFSKIYGIINSKHKKDIRFVSLGTFQIEFFKIEEAEYFSVYRYMPEQAHHMLVDFGVAQVSITENGYQILEGKNTYKIVIIKSKEKLSVKIVQYFWGWLPFQKFIGKVSPTGFATFKSNIEAKVNSIV